VPAPRDDDEVVEDYEVLDEQPSRPAGKSGGGKPALPKQPSAGGRKPSAPVRPGSRSQPKVQPDENGDAAEGAGEPPVYDPNKGKISSRASLQIWIVCIAITVLGLGAVAVDAIFDPMGRRNSGLSNTANNKPKNVGKTTNVQPKNPTEEKALAFKGQVELERTRVRQKKVFKYFDGAYNKFREVRTNAYDVKAGGAGKAERDKAWAEAIREYYNVSYALRLLDYTYKKNADEDFMPVGRLDDMEELTGLVKSNAAALQKEGNIRYQAAYTIIGVYSADIKEFRILISKDVEVNNVFSDEKMIPLFKEAKVKCEKAQQMEPEFDPADIEAVKD
jgi:hypothetical protein